MDGRRVNVQALADFANYIDMIDRHIEQTKG
jgi:hypothetical protein